MTPRRSLNTAAAAGAVLFALCFVPSASATPSNGAPPASSATQAGSATQADAVGSAPTSSTETGTASTDLADTGAIDTTPYLVGGTGFLAVGAALLLAARRRALLTAD